MMKKFIFLFPILISSSIFSDTILFKNGSNIRGKIKSQTFKKLIVETPDGKTQEIYKYLVMKVVYKDVSDDELNKIRKEEEAKMEKKPEAEWQKNSESENEDLKPEKKPEDSSKTKEPPEKYTRFSFLWRSALMPGWGQWVKNEKTKSSLFFFSSVLTAAAVYKYRTEFANAQSRFTENENLLLLLPAGSIKVFAFQERQKEYSDSVNASENVLRASSFLGIVYMINLIDAYFFGNAAAAENTYNSYRIKTGISMNAFQSFNGLSREKNITIQYTWGF